MSDDTGGGDYEDAAVEDDFSFESSGSPTWFYLLRVSRAVFKLDIADDRDDHVAVSDDLITGLAEISRKILKTIRASRGEHGSYRKQVGFAR